MTSETTLLSDPVFQLNTFLWALEDLPEPSRIKSVFGNAGYYLVAIGRGVRMPVDASAVAALKSLTGSPDRSPCRPDLWIKHQEHPVQMVVELKARSFAPGSSNRKQALKLLVGAFDLAPSLGEPTERRGHVVYGTIETDSQQMATPREGLAADVSAEHVQAAPTAVVGLSIESQGAVLSSPTPGDLPEPAAEALATPATVLQRDGDNDLRPPYFVPWIPGIGDTQDPDLRADGFRELTARVLVEAQSHIGRAQAPTTLHIRGEELLRGATLGVFDQWRDTDRSKFTNAAARIVERALKKSQVKIRRYGGDRLEIDLSSGEAKDQAIKRLEQADPADPKKNLQAATREHPKLFEDF